MLFRLIFCIGCLMPTLGFAQQASKVRGTKSPENALQLHRQALVFDTHNDVISELTMKGYDISHRLSVGNTDLVRLREGGVDAQFFSIWCDGTYGPGKAFAWANREIDSLMAIIHRNPDKIALAKSAQDVRRIVAQHKIAALIGVEGGHMIEDRLDYLDSLYKRGMRYMTLTWNNSTDWATSAVDETLHAQELSHKGLTDFGRQVVRRMNELGIIVDLAHVGEQTFYDALAVTTKPVLVSHSSVYALDPVPRNLKDDQIRAVARNGGVICVNFYDAFLDPGFSHRLDSLVDAHPRLRDSLKQLYPETMDFQIHFLKALPEAAYQIKPPLSLLIDHIDYIAKLVGVDYVGLGADFDGAEAYPRGMDDVTCYPLITKALLERGYSPADIRKILGENVMRVLQANSPAGDN
ncbi:dipeptidase [Thermoflavifilum thermophilum]|uniref:Membrane dipeptidase n=1 Tax=Thermoflavifilum thermophilum TaxID=1393122 RepID=A0A1I7NMJ7_9BACT|nr:dipeptidase [Thermoflavifilum thermophilum]SFV35849.1 membrane dipeptidase [Thermoflavifilum thermophilum]